MHFAWQLTSPAAQSFRQAISEDSAASVVVAEATEERVEEATSEDWALAKTVKAPTTRKLANRILDGCKDGFLYDGWIMEQYRDSAQAIVWARENVVKSGRFRGNEKKREKIR
ncbi:hypothetical protein VM1G_02655 [Cytospora mali]|uniref:Uncharacterized protein n=1 Tax=Cytospora mali TaxID=578113 RepID=A0A194VTV4_CYTMA|nr:hypothetical protein VM1G_02655 [Valsa mali]